MTRRCSGCAPARSRDALSASAGSGHEGPDHVICVTRAVTGTATGHQRPGLRRRRLPCSMRPFPPILQGRDVWACAQTGSGKTAAFALPLLQRLLAAPIRRSIAPRRWYSSRRANSPPRSASPSACWHGHCRGRSRWRRVFGGVSINPQMMALRGGADFVVATPGRLLDLVDHNALSLADVETLVLDEADRLVDLGFADELRAILDRLPSRRQNLLFSATFPTEVESLAGGAAARSAAHRHCRQRRTASRPSSNGPSRSTRQPHAAAAPPARSSISWSRVLVFVATQVLDRAHRRQAAAERHQGRRAAWRTEPGHPYQSPRGLQGSRTAGARCD